MVLRQRREGATGALQLRRGVCVCVCRCVGVSVCRCDRLRFGLHFAPDQSGWSLSLSEPLLGVNARRHENLFAGSCADEAVLERRHDQPEDSVLGAGYGRVAPATEHPATQVVPDGDGAGRAQRERPRYAHPQHAHTHVRILPQPVSGVGAVMESRVRCVLSRVNCQLRMVRV